ncbi:MAG: choice-of-anchor Q domain-containing protein [Dokdonella sp.]
MPLKTIVMLAAAAFCAAIAPATAYAFRFCANSQAGIQFSLTASHDNGQDDEIDIPAGTYSLTSNLVFNSTESNSLLVIGGWNSDCSLFTGGRTVLDGQGSVAPLTIYSDNGDIFVQWITFANGAGHGLKAETHNNQIQIDHNRFYLNQGAGNDGAAGLDASTVAGEIRVRGNLLFLNTSTVYTGGISVNSNGSVAYIVGNTIVDNTAGSAGFAGGLSVSGGAHFWVSDNIIWANHTNGAPDFKSNTWNALINNDIGTTAGTPPDAVSQGNQSTDPAFATCTGLLCFSFELTRASPLVDAGYDAPPGSALAVDLDVKPRIIGPHVDIGAYEEDVLFANGFD